MAQEKITVTPNHVSYTVADMHRALTLFTELLGAKEISRAQAANLDGIQGMTNLALESLDIAFLQLGPLKVELLQFAPTKAAPVLTANSPTFAHLAVTVTDFDAFLVEALGFDLLPLGHSMRMLGGADAGKRAIYLRSPDALVIEVIGE
jgi:catechol 2,3-dioxygenase-like lactoylglutathione lyase family enzyme